MEVQTQTNKNKLQNPTHLQAHIQTSLRTNTLTYKHKHTFKNSHTSGGTFGAPRKKVQEKLGRKKSGKIFFNRHGKGHMRTPKNGPASVRPSPFGPIDFPFVRLRSKKELTSDTSNVLSVGHRFFKRRCNGPALFFNRQVPPPTPVFASVFREKIPRIFPVRVAGGRLEKLRTRRGGGSRVFSVLFSKVFLSTLFFMWKRDDR